MKRIDPISNVLGGTFFQCWDLDKTMNEAIDSIFYNSDSNHSSDKSNFIIELSNLFSKIDQDNYIFDTRSVEFDTNRFNITKIEWLVLIKAYLEGNKNVFDHLIDSK